MLRKIISSTILVASISASSVADEKKLYNISINTGAAMQQKFEDITFQTTPVITLGIAREIADKMRLQIDFEYTATAKLYLVKIPAAKISSYSFIFKYVNDFISNDTTAVYSSVGIGWSSLTGKSINNPNNKLTKKNHIFSFGLGTYHKLNDTISLNLGYEFKIYGQKQSQSNLFFSAERNHMSHNILAGIKYHLFFIQIHQLILLSRTLLQLDQEIILQYLSFLLKYI